MLCHFAFIFHLSLVPGQSSIMGKQQKLFRVLKLDSSLKSFLGVLKQIVETPPYWLWITRFAASLKTLNILPAVRWYHCYWCCWSMDWGGHGFISPSFMKKYKSPERQNDVLRLQNNKWGELTFKHVSFSLCMDFTIAHLNLIIHLSLFLFPPPALYSNSYTCTCVHVEGQRSISFIAILTNHSSPYFLVWVCHWTWSSLVKLLWIVSKPWGDSPFSAYSEQGL